MALTREVNPIDLHRTYRLAPMPRQSLNVTEVTSLVTDDEKAIAVIYRDTVSDDDFMIAYMGRMNDGTYSMIDVTSAPRQLYRVIEQARAKLIRTAKGGWDEDSGNYPLHV